MRWKHMMPTYLMFFWSILRHSGVTTAATWKGWRVSSNWQSLPRWNLVKISLSQGVGNQHCCLFCPLFELCHWEVRVKVGGDKQAGQEGVSKSTKVCVSKVFWCVFHLIVWESLGFTVSGKSIRCGSVLYPRKGWQRCFWVKNELRLELKRKVVWLGRLTWCCATSRRDPGSISTTQ